MAGPAPLAESPFDCGGPGQTVEDEDTGENRVERWHVGTGDRIGTGLPLNLLAVVDDEGESRMVYLEDDGPAVGPLPGTD